MPIHLFSSDRQIHKLLFMHTRHAFKTGLAAALAYFISSRLLRSPYSLWAVISTLVVMQGISVADSLQASFSRFTVMSLGALAGMALLVISPDTPVILTAEVFFICALGAYLGRYGNNVTLAATAVCIVLLVGQQIAAHTLTAQVMFGVTLSLEVLLGVSCAVVITTLIWPVRLGDTLRADITSQFEKCAVLLDTVVKSFLDHQHNVPYSQLEGLTIQTRGNQERMAKALKLEAHIYHYEHKGLSIQVNTIERCVESMHFLIDALNEYDERGYDPLTGPELRALADAMASALRCLGEKNLCASPETARDLTLAVDTMETRLNQLRGELLHLSLQHVLQLYAFYMVLRHLSEFLLSAMYQMQCLPKK